jgi:GNAT superfamily N-acetyltransferase
MLLDKCGSLQEYEPLSSIRLCHDDELTTIVAIVNRAAAAYRGVIPSDQWHEPYMTMAGLRGDIATGLAFWGLEMDGELVGVMGMQPVQDVDLIRHAYVLPGRQRRGVGAALIGSVRGQSTRRMLVGTWAAATWAVSFYRRNGFELVSPEQNGALLERYWSISAHQREASVVLAHPPL